MSDRVLPTLLLAMLKFLSQMDETVSSHNVFIYFDLFNNLFKVDKFTKIQCTYYSITVYVLQYIYVLRIQTN